MAERICTVVDCGRTYFASGYCRPHGQRWRKHGDPLAAIPIRGRQAPVCSIDGCGAPTAARGWCHRHWARWKKWGDPTAYWKSAKGHLTAKGYRVVGKDRRGLPILEHRLIMERELGRPLFPEEGVHHKNGRKADNRPANLELWIGWQTQPEGQRVTDLIAFVVEHYPEQVAQALRL